MSRNPVSQKALSLLLSLALFLSIFGVDTVGAYAAQSSSPTKLYLDSGNIVIDGANVTQNGQPVKRGTQDSGYLITQHDSGAIQHSITVHNGTQDITLQNVHAKPTGGQESAGIGGGSRYLGSGGDGGTVYISGGSVNAAGRDGGETIGKGAGGSSSGTLKNKNGGSNVYLTTVTLPTKSADGVTLLSLTQGGSAVSYGITDMKADADGKLYLYLPAFTSGDTTADITANNMTYGGYYGSVTGAGTNVLKMNPVLTVNSLYMYGDVITPTVNGSSSGVTFSYSGRNGTTYASTTAPTNCGDYTVSVTTTQTDSYYGKTLTGSKAANVKFYSTNDKIAAVPKLKNGNYQVTGKSSGTAYIMFDVYDSKNRLLTHASVKIDVKTGIRPRGDSTRQIGIF